MEKRKKKRNGRYSILAEATGYSSDYCRKVIEGDRSQTSKGGKKIMQKLNELNKFLSNG